MSADAPDRQRPLADLLLRSLDRLSAAGADEEACRLAGEACAALRQNDPEGAHRFNLLLHRLVARQKARERRG